MEREYTAVIKKDGRSYVGWLEELPGVNTQGRSLKEVRENLREAARMVLAAEGGMNVVGTQIDTSRSALALAQKYDNVWATIGLHPTHTSKSYHDTKELGEGGKEFTSRGELFDMKVYEDLGKNPKVIAIG